MSQNSLSKSCLKWFPNRLGHSSVAFFCFVCLCVFHSLTLVFAFLFSRETAKHPRRGRKPQKRYPKRKPEIRGAAGRGGNAGQGAGAGPAGAEVPGAKRKRRSRRRAAQVGAGGRAAAGGRSRPRPEPASGTEAGHASPLLCHTLPISIVIRGSLIQPGAVNARASAGEIIGVCARVCVRVRGGGARARDDALGSQQNNEREKAAF